MKADPEILRHLFNKDSLSEIPKETLAEMKERYPAFPLLHWLQAAREPDNKEALQHAALYAYYPLRLLSLVNHPVKKPPQKPVVQPLYTEDYFAYTRTQLPENIKDDKPPTLEQVKSFTGWLQMMKKTQAGPPGGGEAEESPPEMPESETGPNDQEPVVTESMAKIWIQHGQKDKALDIYNKLILLNPEKKSYFAAQISALKEQ